MCNHRIGWLFARRGGGRRARKGRVLVVVAGTGGTGEGRKGKGSDDTEGRDESAMWLIGIEVFGKMVG